MGINFLTVRDKRRKVYGYSKGPERTVTYVINNISKSFDLNTIQTNRSFYLLRQANGSLEGETAIVYGEYEEDYLLFEGTSVATKTFDSPFSFEPIVTLTIEQNATGDQNVNVVLANISTTGIVVSASAPIHGNVRYQAIYASTYPTTVIRNNISGSQTYTAFASYQDLNISDSFQFDYTGFGTPTNVFITPYDNNTNGSVNVGVAASSSYTSSNMTGSLTAKITGRLNYLAIQ